MSSNCDYCESDNLHESYSPFGSNRGAVVFVCRLCGLVQSKYSKQDCIKERTVSSAANWGNIRHGKLIRLAPNVNFLEKHVDLAKVTSVLDVGSSRSAFLKLVRARNARANLVGVEPDSTVVDYCTDLPRTSVINAKLEDVDLGHSKFDLIYSSHTLEHSASAREMLEKTFSLLSDDGVFFLEVPNLAAILDEHNIEEFFIDKHSYHFSRKTLSKILTDLGFSVYKISPPQDDLNISILAGKANRISGGVEMSAEADWIEAIARYARILDTNRGRLKKISVGISNALEGGRTAVWGGGRIFDALIQFGGLDLSKIDFIVDQFMYGCVDKIHGLPVRSVAELQANPTDTVIIAARSAAERLAEEATRMGIRHVINVQNLLRTNENEI